MRNQGEYESLTTPDSSPRRIRPTSSAPTGTVIVNISPVRRNGGRPTVSFDRTELIENGIVELQVLNAEQVYLDTSRRSSWTSFDQNSENASAFNGPCPTQNSSAPHLLVAVHPDLEDASLNNSNAATPLSAGWTNLHTPVTPEMLGFPEMATGECNDATGKIQVIDLPDR